MSLLVALSLTPALCYVLLSKDIQLSSTPPVIAYLNPLYTRLLNAISAHFKLIISLPGVFISRSDALCCAGP